MAAGNQLSFLPEDYLERKAQRRASLICGGLFFCMMGGLGSAFWLSEQASRRLEREAATVDQTYISEARRIEQVKQMQDKQRRMAHQAEMTASLLERIPRSYLLAEYTNTLPAGVSLLDLILDSKVAQAAPVAAPAKTAFEQKKAAKKGNTDPGPTPLPPPKKYDVTVKLTGIAMNDGQVAQYLKKLSDSPLFKDVNLLVSQETTVDKQPMRKFEIEMLLNPQADVQQLTSPTASTAVEITPAK